MALSDREQAIFDNLVNGLGDDAQKIDKKVTDNKLRWIIILVIGFLASIVLLILGVFTKLIILGVLGFAIMLAVGVRASQYIPFR